MQVLHVYFNSHSVPVSKSKGGSSNCTGVSEVYTAPGMQVHFCDLRLLEQE